MGEDHESLRASRLPQVGMQDRRPDDDFNDVRGECRLHHPTSDRRKSVSRFRRIIRSVRRGAAPPIERVRLA
jgi:hypothetical protein